MMVRWSRGDELTEDYNFPNGMNIHVDFGVIWKDDKYHQCFSRYVGSIRRSQLVDFSGKVITELIEDNPDEMNYEKEQKIRDAGLRLGDEFERIINFPNGYTAKIEYWITPAERDEKFGRYDAKYQRKILLYENNNILSDVIDYNPYYIDPTPRDDIIIVNYLDADFV